jgi:putative glutathione S-transferase
LFNRAHDKAVTELVASFDKATDILSKQRYLAGYRFTLADIRLVVTLFRFDEVYNVYLTTRSTVGT